MPQSQPWQQAGFSDMQILQQQVMFKQMQEMQRQQQFQSFTDSRQHSGILKNVDGASQYSPVINGTPVHSGSNLFTNWRQQSGSPSLQEMSQLESAQDNGFAYGGDGVQQYGGSAYDSPVPGAGRGMNQIYLQGSSSGSPMQQQLGFTHSFSGGQNLDSSNQPFSLRQDYLKNSFYGQVHQKTNEDSTSVSFEHASVLPKNTMPYVINENEQSVWLSNQLDNNLKHISLSQGSATLDPLEEKILFSMDDNPWDISSGKSSEAGAGNTGNALRSWSALMQSALGETSSGETGLQEEWSGLTFQNTDPSTDNQPSNFVERGYQQTESLENSIQPASALSVTEYQYLNSPGVIFPGFHQGVANTQSEQGRSLHSSHEHNQVFNQSGGRFDSNHQQSSQIVGKPQSHSMTQTKHGWPSPGHGRAESNSSQLHFVSADQQTNDNDFWSEQKGHSGLSSSLVHNNVRMNNFPSGPNSRTSLVSAETQNQENNQLACAYQTNTADTIKDGGRMVNQHVSNHSPIALDVYSMQSNSNAATLSSHGKPETDVSNSLNNPLLSHASNLSSQRSQNVLQLLQNINQARAEGPLVHSSPISQGQKTGVASVSQFNNLSASQGPSLPPSPSQGYMNHNATQASQNYWQKSGGAPVIPSSVPNQSQLQWQQMSRSAVGAQPMQTALYSASSRYANSIASPQQNSPGSTNANISVQQYTGHGAHSTSQPSMTSNFSQRDVFLTKPINQWTDVPVQKHFIGNKSESVQGSGSSDKHVEEMIACPQNLNEQETENVMLGGSSVKPVVKYEEEKCMPHISSEVQQRLSVIQPASEMQELAEKQAGRVEKNFSMNQMNILYGNQEDTICSTNAVAITRPNKRKSRTSELLPWHEEVATVSITFSNIRMGEHDWAQATNQLMEVANEAELLKFGQAIIRPRKRLILTTRLMQTLLHPVPRTILSMVAASAYENIAYIVARLSLGDSCNMSSARAKTDLANISYKEEKSNLDKVLENFSKRIKRLEDVLQRSEEGIPSIVDINVEYMDLERFSVINRFAKFHSRPQPNPSDPFSSGPPKTYPQRYISAFPMPKEIPDGLQCISL